MAIIEICGLFAIISLLLYYYITRKNDYWKKRGIPYEKPMPVFGNLFDAFTTKRNQGQIINDIYSKFKGEKVVGMFNFLTPGLIIRDPELVNKILVTDFHSFANNSIQVDEDLDPILARNMFVQRGEKWKRTRQAMSPAFTVGRIKPTFDTIITVVEQFTTWLENNPEVEAKSALSLFTSEIVASWGIGIDGHSFSVKDPILPRLGKMMFEPSLSTIFKFLIMTVSPTLSKALRVKFVPDEVPAFFDTMLRDLIKQREISGDKRSDFLQYYIDLRKKRLAGKNDDQNDVSEDDIVAGVVSFFIEGYETSSIVSSFLIFYLVNNPELQTSLRAEVDSMFEKANNKPQLDDILNLPLLGRIFSETVRIHGALNMSKQCTKATELDIGNGKTLLIEEGMDILIPIFGLQNDPEHWDNPEIFDPNRFTEEAKASRKKGIYIPFGDGPRMCIGYRMVLCMIKTVVAYIVHNFDILPTEKTAKEYVQDPKHFITMQLGGIHVRFQKRK